MIALRSADSTESRPNAPAPVKESSGRRNASESFRRRRAEVVRIGEHDLAVLVPFAPAQGDHFWSRPDTFRLVTSETSPISKSKLAGAEE